MLNVDLQTVLTLAIVLSAAVYLLKKWRAPSVKKNCGDSCSNCGGCASTPAVETVAISLRDASHPPKIAAH
jgi:hypothetical protein